VGDTDQVNAKMDYNPKPNSKKNMGSGALAQD